VTAVEAYELTTEGGATDFARLIAACEAFGPYCLIGGLAVNCSTLDADFVVIASNLAALATHLRAQGFTTEEHPHSLNAVAPASQLHIQFPTDGRYQSVLARPVDAEVLGVQVKIACLERCHARQTLGLRGSPAPSKQAQEG
jgi:hypothetical protein